MDEATVERLAREVGGRFKVATLAMKRMMEINRGSQPLVESEGGHMLDTVLKELELGLVRLVPILPAPEEGEQDVTQSDEAAAEETE